MMLNKKNIISNTIHDSSYGNGELLYDISDINSNWGYVTQSFDIIHMDQHGYHIYSSNFDIFDKKGNETTLFHYPKEDKEILWDVIFSIKKEFIKDYKPYAIEHFIENQFLFKSRFNRYKKQLENNNYMVLCDKTNHITVLKRKN